MQWQIPLVDLEQLFLLCGGEYEFSLVDVDRVLKFRWLFQSDSLCNGALSLDPPRGGGFSQSYKVVVPSRPEWPSHV